MQGCFPLCKSIIPEVEASAPRGISGEFPREQLEQARGRRKMATLAEQKERQSGQRDENQSV